MTPKQVRNCRVGDILLYKDEESRVITNIVHRGEVWTLRSTSLTGENPHFDTYDASDSLNVWGIQGALF